MGATISLNPFQRISLAFEVLFEPSVPDAASLQAEIIALQSQVSSLTQQNQSLNSANQQLNTQISSLKQENQNLSIALNAWTAEFPGATPQQIQYEITNLTNKIRKGIQEAINAQLSADNGLVNPFTASIINELSLQVHGSLYNDLIQLSNDLSFALSNLSTYASVLYNSTSDDLSTLQNAFNSFVAFNNIYAGNFAKDFITLFNFWTNTIIPNWPTLQALFDSVFRQLPNLPTFLSTANTTPPGLPSISDLSNVMNNGVSPRINVLPGVQSYAQSLPLGGLPNDQTTINTAETTISNIVTQAQNLQLHAVDPGTITP
jgi:FtsZ-binding cell division protein ZapB